jgi:Uncharacterized conserved protein (DUF2358)
MAPEAKPAFLPAAPSGVPGTNGTSHHRLGLRHRHARCCSNSGSSSSPAASGDNDNNQPPPTPQQVALLRALRQELPTLFDKDSPGPDLALYAPSVLFTDPLNRFRGARRYAANIAFLRRSPVFRDARLFLHDAWIPPPAAAPRPPPPAAAAAAAANNNTVRTRWTLDMVANLPWRPRVAFTGTSDYALDADGKVAEHVDRWDSLDPEQNKFPSLAAVRDLVTQCAYKRPVPDPTIADGGPPFMLLRRARGYDIRRYAHHRRNSSSTTAALFDNEVAVVNLTTTGSDDRNDVDSPRRFEELKQSTSPLGSPFMVVADVNAVSHALCCFTEGTDASDLTKHRNGAQLDKSDIFVAVSVFADQPTCRDDVLLARNKLLSSIKKDLGVVLLPDEKARTWITRYRCSRSRPEFCELWLEIDSLDTRS